MYKQERYFISLLYSTGRDQLQIELYCECYDEASPVQQMFFSSSLLTQGHKVDTRDAYQIITVY